MNTKLDFETIDMLSKVILFEGKKYTLNICSRYATISI